MKTEKKANGESENCFLECSFLYFLTLISFHGNILYFLKMNYHTISYFKNISLSIHSIGFSFLLYKSETYTHKIRDIQLSHYRKIKICPVYTIIITDYAYIDLTCTSHLCTMSRAKTRSSHNSE